MTGVDAGADLFARFAYAPNDLGYCGPADAAALRDGSTEEIRGVARRFSGVWPYLRVIARMSGIADPLDERVVRAYWLGGGLGDRLDRTLFLDELLSMIAPVAGPYWRHLNTGLVAEAAPDHCFHVFGVYPWSRLLGRGAGEHPLRILDSCRITWATVLDRHDDDLTVRARRLLWDGRTLTLSEPEVRHAVLDPGRDAGIGDRVAVHWGRVCGRLDFAGIAALTAGTDRQLRATNRRLAGR